MKATIKIPRAQTCKMCDGSGADPEVGTEACSACGGQGQVRFQQGFFTISRTCGSCQGTGRVIKKRCPECRGEGRVAREKVLELKIPSGVETGSRLRVVGEGEAGFNGGPPGDLYVVIRVQEHPFFKRQGDDILCEVPISFDQAALGAEIKVPTLTGEERLRIPEGTQTGTVFRFRGRGVSNVNGRGRGDQLIAVAVRTPTKLTRRQRELLEEFGRDMEPLNKNWQSEGLFDKVKDMFS
jgi:molecular chaperone DnaJ